METLSTILGLYLPALVLSLFAGVMHLVIRTSLYDCKSNLYDCKSNFDTKIKNKDVVIGVVLCLTPLVQLFMILFFVVSIIWDLLDMLFIVLKDVYSKAKKTIEDKGISKWLNQPICRD